MDIDTETRIREAMIILRKRAGMTQGQLGMAMGMSNLRTAQGVISRWETGAATMRLVTLLRYLEAVGASLVDLANLATP